MNAHRFVDVARAAGHPRKHRRPPRRVAADADVEPGSALAIHLRGSMVDEEAADAASDADDHGDDVGEVRASKR